jgi:hypothetical protein
MTGWGIIWAFGDFSTVFSSIGNATFRRFDNFMKRLPDLWTFRSIGRFDFQRDSITALDVSWHCHWGFDGGKSLLVGNSQEISIFLDVNCFSPFPLLNPRVEFRGRTCATSEWNWWCLRWFWPILMNQSVLFQLLVIFFLSDDTWFVYPRPHLICSHTDSSNLKSEMRQEVFRLVTV